MSTYAVNLTVTTTLHFTDEQARDVARRWIGRCATSVHLAGPEQPPGPDGTRTALQLLLTSTSRDEPWLHVSAAFTTDGDVRPDDLLTGAMRELTDALLDAGAAVATWETVELLSQAEVDRRLARPAIPPMVNAGELAELAGISVQRIYQLESERAAGRRGDFPAPALDGYWLRSTAEHWARTRRTRPGPAPKAGRDEGV